MIGDLQESATERLQKKVSQMERLTALAKHHKPFYGMGGDELAYMQTMAAYYRLAESIEEERRPKSDEKDV